MRELRIMIADDHELMRRGVRNLLSVRRQWQVVGEARDGVEAVALAERLRPDIAILDFSMPRMNGPEATARMTKILPKMGVVVLTMHDSEQVIDQVRGAGARGLVCKGDADRNLLDAVDAVSESRVFFPIRGSAWLDGDDLNQRSTSVPTAQSTAAQLTDREREVMCLLAEGMTSKATALRLHISTRTVETHRININRKLGFHSIADMVRYAMRNGMSIAASTRPSASS